MNIKKFTQKDRYGNSMSFEFDVPPMQEIPQGGGQHPGMPVGTDTVPAWLTPGEFVMNAEATRKFKPQLEAMNNHGRVQQKAQGGSIPSPAPVYKNQGGQVPGYQGNGMTGMAGGLMAMDPMMSMSMPTNNSAMDTMVQPQMIPQRQPMPNQMAPIAQGYAPLYRQGGGYIDPRANQIDDETAMFLKQMEELRQQQNKPSIIQGFIPGNEQVPAGKMIGSQGVQPVIPMDVPPVHQFEAYPEPVQAVQGAESPFVVTQDGLPLNIDGQPFTDSKLSVPTEYDPSAPAQNASPSYLDKMTQVESRGKADAKNPKSTATGLHQFTQGTWLSVVERYEPELMQGKTREELLELRKDPTISKRMAAYLTTENENILTRKGIEPTDGNLYLAHFAGPSGASKLIQADPNTPVSEILSPEAIKANEKVLKGKTAGEVVAWANSKMGVQVGQGNLTDDELAKHMSNLDNGVDDGVNIPGISSAEAAVPQPEGLTEFPRGGLASEQGIPQVDPNAMVDAQKRREHPIYGETFASSRSPAKPPEATPEEIKRQEYAEYVEWFEQQIPHSSFQRPEDRPVPLSYEEWGGGKPEESLRGGDGPEETPEGTHGTYEDYKAGQEALGNPVMSEEDWKKSTGVGKPEFKEFPRSNLSSEAQTVLEDIVDETEKGLTQEELDAAIQMDEDLRSGKIENAAVQAPEGSMEKVMSFLEEWGIADLFDKKEIGRMAALYLGSRMLGYSHGGSINWAAKQYLTRVDAKAANHDKQVAKWLEDGTFTKESIAEYKRTKDINDLQKPGVSYTPLGNSEYKLITVKGKDGKYSQQRVKVREMKGSDGGTYWQLPNGKNVDALLLDDDKPENVKGTDEYYAKNSRVRGDVLGTFTSELNLLDTENNRGNREGQTPRPVGFTPATAAEDYVAFARELGLDPESPFVRSMATNALHEAYDQALKGTKGRSYGEYLHQMFIRETTGAIENLSLGVDKNGREQFVDAALIGVLNRDMVITARQKRRNLNLPEVSDQELRQTMYNSAMKAWGELGEDVKKEWNRKATDGETTGFYEFMKAKLLDFKVS